jgi:GT2 family glycosyltransferase
LDLTPESRGPLTLPAQTAHDLLTRPVPSVARSVGAPGTSVVVVTWNHLAVTRLALESLLLGHVELPYEVVVVDNASSDGTREYLQVLSARNPHVRLVENSTNRGFAAARNQGVALTTGDVVVLLKSDIAVPPATLGRLAEHLDDPEIGLVGPVTNRCGNEAEVPTGYRTYAEMLAEARQRSARRSSPRDIPLAVMFCVAARAGTLRRVGPLDERFRLGMFQDDDYALRIRQQGLRVTCADDVFVHHFGEPSLRTLAHDGRSGSLFHESRESFERKWGRTWQPPARTSDGVYVPRALLDELDG